MAIKNNQTVNNYTGTETKRTTGIMFYLEMTIETPAIDSSEVVKNSGHVVCQ